jgi:hypothetical protein
MGVLPDPIRFVATTLGVDGDHYDETREDYENNEPVGGPPPGPVVGPPIFGIASSTVGRLGQLGGIIGFEAGEDVSEDPELREDINDVFDPDASSDPTGDGPESPLVTVARFLRTLQENSRAILSGVVALVVVYTVGQLITVNVGDSSE